MITQNPVPAPQKGAPRVASSPLGPRFVTKKELAALIGCSPRCIEKMTAAGKLPALKLSGRLVRYDYDAVFRALKRFETVLVGEAQ